MKLKYFMRGLGIGIIFGAIVMLVAAGTSDKEKLTDEEIKNRAKSLGMVEATQTDASITAESDIKVTTEALIAEDLTVEIVTTEAAEIKTTTEETATEEETTEATTEAVTTEKETTEKTTTEATTTELTTTEAVTTENKKETTTEKKTDSSYTEATITVTRGMGSPEVSMLLQEAGIIEDADDFDSYLVKQGISNKIQINTFKFNSNMSYEDIAKGLTTPKND